MNMKYTYNDILNKMLDLKALSTPPIPGEVSGCFSSYDRRSRYNKATGLYEEWGANNDGNGYIRKEGNDIVALEIDGPGVIWRVWSANPQAGHIRIFIDGSPSPVLDVPFRNLFERFGAEGGQFWPANFPQLLPTLSRGKNRFIPISFSKGCKITFEPEWGMFYHFTYTRFPEGTVLPSYSPMLERAAQMRLAEIDRRLALRNQYGGIAKEQAGNIQWQTHTCHPHNDTILYENLSPGAITSFILETETTTTAEQLEALTIEMYWDGKDIPAITCSLPNFFSCIGSAKDFSCLPVAKVQNRYISRWHMPYTSARIVLQSKGNAPIVIKTGFATDKISDSEATSKMRFFARTHGDEFEGLDTARFVESGDRWPDWPMLRCKGIGRLCGVHLEIDNRWAEPDKPADEWWYGIAENKTIDWWWGEGDEKFFVDGEKFPSTFGTGSEDYIGYAWAAEPPFALFDSAFACQNAVPINGNGLTSVARFHIGDNIPFQKSLECFIEKYKANTWDNNRAVCEYKVTCYWYMMSGGKEQGRP